MIIKKGEKLQKTMNKVFEKNKSINFAIIFIIGVVGLFISFILWSIFSIKTYVVKASGVVTDQYKENIMNYSTGEINI